MAGGIGIVLFTSDIGRVRTYCCSGRYSCHNFFLDKERNIIVLGRMCSTDRAHRTKTAGSPAPEGENTSNCKAYSTVSETDCDCATTVGHTESGAPYVICNARHLFQNPTTSPTTTAAKTNETLNLGLGSEYATPLANFFRPIVYVLDRMVFRWWQGLFFYLITNVIPLRVKRFLVLGVWSLFLRIHRRFLGNTTAIHKSVSEEYHAFTTFVWCCRVLRYTTERVHFMLSQFHVISLLAPPPPERTMQINETLEWENGDHNAVRGRFVFRHDKDRPSKHVIMWLYGGAYLGGDSESSAPIVERIAKESHMDVFIPDFRSAPSARLDEMQWDVCLAYRWLCQRLNDPSASVFLMGFSSGAGLATRLMQLIEETARGEDNEFQESVSKVLTGLPKPSGAVLFGPFVDFDLDFKGSMLHYTRHDLIVNECLVQLASECCLDFLPPVHGAGDYPHEMYSPLRKSMRGLPPILVVCSEHECFFDMSVSLVNKARGEGVDATIIAFKYLCHIFSMFEGLIPEGRLSVDLTCDWLLKRTRTKLKHS